MRLFTSTPESPHYLLIENAFPNGHPPLEQCGVIITRRDIVEKSAQMKVSTCMNPMDTALGVFGLHARLPSATR